MMHPQALPRASRWPLCAAFVAAVLVIAIACLVPMVTRQHYIPPATPPGHPVVFYSAPRDTLLTASGIAGLAIAALPAVVTALVGMLLTRGPGDRGRYRAASVLAGLFLLAAGIGAITFLIGLLAVPSGVFLLVATANARTSPRGATPARPAYP